MNLWALFIGLLTVSSYTVSGLSQDVEDLFDEYFDWKMRLMPDLASQKGFPEYEDQLPNKSLDHLAKIPFVCRKYLARAEAILRKPKTTLRENYYLRLLVYEVTSCIDGFKHKGYFFTDVNFLFGVQDMGSDLATVSFSTLNDYQKFLRKVKAIPKLLEENEKLLRLGVKTGMTYAKESLAQVAEQFKRLQVDGRASEFFQPFKNMAESKFSKTQIRQIQERALQAINDQLLPAYEKLHNYIEKTYMKHVRSGPGISNIPKGREYYQACIDFHTSMKGLTPEIVHQIGLDSVNELQQGVVKLAKSRGLNMTSAQYLAYAAQEPFFGFVSKDDVFREYHRTFQRDIFPKLKDYFLPEDLPEKVYSLNIVNFPPSWFGIAYYSAAPRDGSRNGSFYLNMRDYEYLRTYETVPLCLHEGTPGHHLQFSFNAKHDFPQFVSVPLYGSYAEVPSTFPMYSAHVEGWGLYSEYLGWEMGLFDDDDAIGYYVYSLLRSARLVVDTGIHALGWSRQRAVNYLVESTGMDVPKAEGEIDRYITWPGQALGYRIGEKHIRDVRRKMEARSDFDLRRFHHSVLSCLGPMSELEDCIELQQSPEWTEGEIGAAGVSLGSNKGLIWVFMLAFGLIWL